MGITLANRINIARHLTVETAGIEDCHIRSKHNYAMRQIARQITAGKGYVLATPKEMADRYPGFFKCDIFAPDLNRKYIWGIGKNYVYKRLEFIPV